METTCEAIETSTAEALRIDAERLRAPCDLFLGKP